MHVLPDEASGLAKHQRLNGRYYRMSRCGPDAEYLRIKQPPVSSAGMADPKQISRLQGVRHAGPVNKLTAIPDFNLLAHSQHHAGTDLRALARLNQCIRPFKAIRHRSPMPDTR